MPDSTEQMRCEIVTPETRMFANPVEFVTLPAAEGQMGVYRRHSPQVVMLGEGCVSVTFADPETGAESVERFAVMGGYAEVTGDEVIVLANRAEQLDAADAQQATQNIAQLEAELAALGQQDPGRMFLEQEIRWNKLIMHLCEVG